MGGMTCIRTTEAVDERIDGVILALDGCGWMTERELVDKMSCMTLVASYQAEHIHYTLTKMRLKGLVECRRRDVSYEYKLMSL